MYSIRALPVVTRCGPRSRGGRGQTSGNGSADPPHGLTYCAAGAYRRKVLFGTCAFRKPRTRLIVRCFNSSGSFHGNTVISAFGASEATSIEVAADAPVRHPAAPASACGSS